MDSRRGGDEAEADEEGMSVDLSGRVLVLLVFTLLLSLA